MKIVCTTFWFDPPPPPSSSSPSPPQPRTHYRIYTQEHKCSMRPMHKNGINGLHLHNFPFDLWFNVWVHSTKLYWCMKSSSNKVKNTCEASNVINSHIKQNQNFLCSTKNNMLQWNQWNKYWVSCVSSENELQLRSTKLIKSWYKANKDNNETITINELNVASRFPRQNSKTRKLKGQIAKWFEFCICYY